MQNPQSLSRPIARGKTFDLILTSMLVALVFVSTMLLNIRIPFFAANGGLVHLGTAMLFISAMLFGPKKGAAAGALGMGLFDIMGGWLLWAPITIVARGIQGYVVGKVAWSKNRNGTSIGWNIAAAVISIPFMLVVYYIGEAIMFSSFVIPLASIPGNLIQNAVGLLIAIPVVIALKKLPYFK
ncbi:putative membrane protein [Chryseomicrobium aureum]|uniref:ECF transporter S component n=1 Tax=Chryseomicrobium aureum TaxID=1441723 RepID=UPI00195B20CB|nr:ECF transporter S component [Chryseomicrobium aureum]MBM7707144.1 putative membrane protein [Chryseomicrobium aureum]